MAVTKEELREFTRFADEKLAQGDVESIVDLAGQWETRCRNATTSTDKGEPIFEDISEETLRFLAAAFPDVRDDEKLRDALSRRGGVTTAQMLANAAAAVEKASDK
jgi:hypothetical protein